MPRVSVVIPVFNVERYLDECLDSLEAQEVWDFEAILVDDGSTDASGAIAERRAARDPRLRVVHRRNGGLGSARNLGAALAQGEFLAFLDSDDKLPPCAFSRLLRTLDRTGSDLASGNVHRFDARGTWPAAFLARVFLLPRRRTHVTRLRWLLSDRMAQNKLWRRTFWDAHAFRFPEGRYHEDIPVTVPAHFLARSVDVVTEPTYLYREREDGVPSITQRRAELRILRDRFTAVEQVSAFLGARSAAAKRWYDTSVVEDDLRYHVDVLDGADDAYRAYFLDRANAFLDAAAPVIERTLPPIQRRKWQLVRERRLDDLLALVAFQKAGGRIGGPLETARRRARHAVTLTRPYWTPHRPITKRRLLAPPPAAAAPVPARV